MTIQQSPYLRQQRQFPNTDVNALANQADQAYVETALAVNDRSIGIYALNTQVIVGDKWFLQGQSKPQQILRKLFQFTAAGSIAHGINFATITGITKIYGTFTNGTNWYPLPYVDVTAANNQVNVIVTPTNIVITAGAGTPPAITTGWVIVEWLSQF